MGAMSRMVELKEEKKKITKTEIYKSWKAAYESSLERAKRIGKTGRVEEYASAMKEVERYKSECPSKEIDAEMSKGEEYIKLATYFRYIFCQLREFLSHKYHYLPNMRL